MRIRIYHGLALCLVLAGCTDFAGVRLDGVPSRRGVPDAAQRPPQPVPTLIIPEPPLCRLIHKLLPRGTTLEDAVFSPCDSH